LPLVVHVASLAFDSRHISESELAPFVILRLVHKGAKFCDIPCRWLFWFALSARAVRNGKESISMVPLLAMELGHWQHLEYTV